MPYRELLLRYGIVVYINTCPQGFIIRAEGFSSRGFAIPVLLNSGFVIRHRQGPND